MGKNLIELDLRQRYEVSVIGLIEQYNVSGDVEPHVHLNPNPEHPLSADDLLVVIGTDAQLSAFIAAVEAKNEIYSAK